MSAPDVVDDPDDDYEPPVAVRVEHEVIDTCPACGKRVARHSSLDLLRCIGDGQDGNDIVEGPGVETSAGSVAPGSSPPEPPGEFDVWKSRRPRRTLVAGPARTPPHEPAPPSSDLDYEQLAAAMRTVLEKERDEMVKRGGPIEKQIIELKERLADAFDQVGIWRARAQSAAEARNSLQDQLTAQIKVNRKLRTSKQGDRSGDRPKVVELKDILAQVERTPGFEVKRQGNGHYGIYKNGEWVTDAASTGSGYKVDMATRVKLKKAGVDV